MVYPKRAKWAAATVAADSVGTDQLEAGAVHTADIADDAVDATKLSDADDFTVGTLEAAGKVLGLPIQTKDAHHTGVALADLTAAFGAPATLPNGSLFTYKNDTDAKIYLVAVVGSVFQAVEMTHITA